MNAKASSCAVKQKEIALLRTCNVGITNEPGRRRPRPPLVNLGLQKLCHALVVLLTHIKKGTVEQRSCQKRGEPDRVGVKANRGDET